MDMIMGHIVYSSTFPFAIYKSPLQRAVAFVCVWNILEPAHLTPHGKIMSLCPCDSLGLFHVA